MKLALIGAGQRGMIYSRHAYQSADIVAVVEPDDIRRKAAADEFHIPPERQFVTVEAFYALGKICDAVIISSMDRDHYKQTMAALELGYDILLEKPISPSPEECLKIQEKADEKGRKVIVCHVLRYTNFFAEIKKIIDSQQLGKVITIQHNENIGNFHMAHSFVRGNWRRSDLASPIIMQKSCHDMDILSWLVDSGAKRISSYGGLAYFKEENAPAGSAERCLDCKVAADCRFDARKAYLPVRGQWPAAAVAADQSEEGLLKALETGPYGRCVYKLDNDVCDHQVTLIEFKNGVTATFNLSGFTNKMYRTLKIMCEHGEIRGDDSLNVIEVTRFNSNMVEAGKQTVIRPAVMSGGHNGGDTGLMNDFLNNLQNPDFNSRSSIDRSVESHMMAYAAEEARMTGTIIDMDELRERLKHNATA
ncbi:MULTISPECIES: Gfo/Idh/MocA family protein [Paenibacillus]|uniref:Oxidoreductase n=1 Tax=Paenibacillus campinasensis TaxID=66347 RepID=A0A268F1K6_9BACL|nr:MULTISPECIES: Gfo/Idh/MocA family oxidoreductase [Paenibacillus]MUG65694.1 gfo/Idh/MocA family oxidoreductase [Paenibacillus campinasensis]PAD79268.1 oxidoreductase [Paenibacillus campinasensis]PAK54262.1 oxidoreductase [Paenibacillus sp. 7541]